MKPDLSTICKKNLSLWALCKEEEFGRKKGKGSEAFFNHTLSSKVNQDTKRSVAAQLHYTITEFKAGLQTCK